MEGVFFILIFMGVIAITALLFGVWVIVGVVRIAARLLSVLFVAPCGKRAPLARALPAIRCNNEHCHATNPSIACFCRRCGTALEVQHTSARRAAVC